MITVGIDVGSKITKVVLLKDGKVAASVKKPSSLRNAIDATIEEAAQQAEITRDQIDRFASTGVGAQGVKFADEQYTVVGSVAKGAAWLFPAGEMVIDVGAEESRIVKYNAEGQAVDFVTNEKCAAGAGSFVESVARALDLNNTAEMGPLSLDSSATIAVNGQCVVFAESEVVSLIHQGESAGDIAKAVYDSVAGRIRSMVMRIGMDGDVVVSGGVSHDVGFISSLKNSLEKDFLMPEEPIYIGALGAALSVAG